MQCIDHLREVGLAVHNHHAANKELPPGWTFDPSAQSAYGWAVSLLPYLSQSALSEQIDVTKTIGDPRHDSARATVLEVLLCPSDITEPTFTLYADDEDENENEASGLTAGLPLSGVPVPLALIELPTANYVGVFGTIESDDSIPAPLGDGCFLENRVTRFRDFQRGLSSTIIVGERTMAQVPSTWFGVVLSGEDASARLVGSALEGINNVWADECDYSSRHPGGANFLWGDGHVSFITQHVDLREYHRWARLRIDADL